MSDNLSITDFLEPVHRGTLSGDEGYRDGQVGRVVSVYEDELPDVSGADIIILGCSESRGQFPIAVGHESVDAIRHQLYQLYFWHSELKVVDLGNVRIGAGLNDSYAALRTILEELHGMGKSVLIIGGSHDLMLPQYYALGREGKLMEAACVDALIDLNMDSPVPAESFLMELLTGEPNHLRHYSHIGFQSYYVHPHMLETMDKLRFDCYRVGTIRENIEEMEPVIRSSDLFSFDISAIANAFAPATAISPNGFNGEEACSLMRYAGLSTSLKSVGIYGYDYRKDRDQLTAMQISQMIWYYIDGRARGKREAALEDKDLFNEYHTAFAEVATTFLQSKKTGRWWMQLPDRSFIACSYNDYLIASSNETPERWLRAQERI